MKHEASKAKIAGYVFVLLVAIYLALLMGVLIPMFFWPVSLLAGITILIVNFHFRRSEA